MRTKFIRFNAQPAIPPDVRNPRPHCPLPRILPRRASALNLLRISTWNAGRMRIAGCKAGFVPLTRYPWPRGRNERVRKGVQLNTVSQREHCHFAMTAPVCNRVVLRIEYNGRAFHGWERKPGLRTVQGTIEDTLADIEGVAVRTVAASKTDAGAHAVGQVLHFDACKHLSGNR
jgi:hypothetical protein